MLLSLLFACAPGEGPDPAAVAALEAFVSSPEVPTFYGPEADASPQDIEGLRSAVDGHHDMVRAWVDYQGAPHWLFGQVQDEALLWAAVVPPAPDEGSLGEPSESYMAAWGVPAAERPALLEPVWADEARYVDPGTEGVGVAGLSEVIDDFDDQFPRADLLPASGVVTQDAFLHFRWKMDAPLIKMDGMDVGLVGPDGRLELIAGFFGELELD